jgi:hypothetical protein
MMMACLQHLRNRRRLVAMTVALSVPSSSLALPQQPASSWPPLP